MNISELNHLENVNDASLVNGGYVSVGSSAGASASGFLPSVYTYSDVYTSNYSDYYYYGGSSYGSASSSAGASALYGSASAGTSASGYADSGYYYYY